MEKLLDEVVPIVVGEEETDVWTDLVDDEVDLEAWGALDEVLHGEGSLVSLDAFDYLAF